MMKLLTALFLLLSATPALAQNVTCATRPYGDNSNACASTAFVQGAVGVLPPIGTSEVLGNFSGVSAPPTGQSVPSCANDGGHVLTNPNGDGFSCTAITSSGIDAGGATSVFNGSPYDLLYETAAGKVGHFSNYVYNVKAYGAVGDGVTNDQPAIASALTACSATGGIVYLPHTLANVYLVNSSVSVPSGCTLEGTGGGVPVLDGNTNSIKAGSSFPTGTPVVLVWDAVRAGVKNLVVDCNGVSNCVGIRYASDNNPITTMGTFHNLSIVNAHIGFVCGDIAAPVSVTGATVNGSGPYTITYTTSSTLPWAVGTTHSFGEVVGATPSGFNNYGALVTVTSSTTFTMQASANPGTYTSGGTVLQGDEADFADLDNVFIEGNGDISAIGLQINSADCFQASTINRLQTQRVNVAVLGLVSNGVTTFTNMNGGAWSGYDNAFFWFQQYYGGDYTLNNVETEGEYGTGVNQLQWALLDSGGTVTGRQNPVVLENNKFYIGDINLNGTGLYQSTGNVFGSSNISAGGTTSVCSQQDYGTWTGASSGTLKCHLQGVGDAIRNSPAGNVTISNTLTQVTTLNNVTTGIWQVNANATLNGISPSANVTCYISDGASNFAQAGGSANTSTTTNLAITAIVTNPQGPIALNCNTVTGSTTATVTTQTNLTGVRVNN